MHHDHDHRWKQLPRPIKDAKSTAPHPPSLATSSFTSRISDSKQKLRSHWGVIPTLKSTSYGVLLPSVSSILLESKSADYRLCTAEREVQAGLPEKETKSQKQNVWGLHLKNKAPMEEGL
jgi:hypothetical protein